MNKLTIAGTLLIIVIASSTIVIGYSQNWFQSTSNLHSGNQTTLSLTLEIYGNVNLDDKIDEKDLDYVNKIIAGTANNTKFADANKDGIIDEKDFEQINAIIEGKATQIHMLDGNGKDTMISLPANRIVLEYIQNAELIRVLELEDKVVGVDYCVDVLKSFYFPENSGNIQSVGQMYTPDYEVVLNLAPDILLTFSSDTTEKASKLPGVDVVFLGLYYPNVTAPEDSKFIQGILKAGYIFNKVPQATKYANWLLELTSNISEKTSTLTENQQKTVLITNYPYATSSTIKAYATVDTLGQVCILAGGSNVAKELPSYLSASSVNVDAEWVLEKNPEYIFLHTVRYTFSGLMYNDPAQGYNVGSTESISSCLQEYVTQPFFADLTAVKKDNVYIIAGDFRNNAMGGVLGAVYTAKVLYPDLFRDLNPKAIHQEYINEYMRIDYDLDTNGVFLYPPLIINGDSIGVPNGE